jgi:hypothetical protein
MKEPKNLSMCANTNYHIFSFLFFRKVEVLGVHRGSKKEAGNLAGLQGRR